MDHSKQSNPFFDFSWKQGNIVRLKAPYKPGVPAKALLNAITAQSDSSVPYSPAPYHNWQGFTHGIIVDILMHEAGRGVTSVSLHLYDPALCVLYVGHASGIPNYVDFGVDDLIPWHRAGDENYETLTN